MGFPRIYTIVKSYRSKYPRNVLLLDAGDTFHGTVFANLSRGANVATLMDTMKYDAIAVGNHDVNFGLPRLEELDAMLENSTILAANLTDATGRHPFKPYIIKALGPNGNVKVGIFSLTTPETVFKANPAYAKDIRVEDAVETARKMVAELKPQVSFIICLSHLGTNPSYEVTSLDIARKVRGIDLIVDGHSHTILEHGITESGTTIVQAGYSDKYLGIVDVKFGRNGTTITPSLISAADAASYDESQSLLATAQSLDEQNRIIMNKPVGTTAELLDGERVHARTGRTNLGTLVTEAMTKVSGSDAGLINGGGIRASIPAGTITWGQVLQVLPFGNTLRVIEIEGRYIDAALEHGVGVLPEAAGKFPQTYGIDYTLDATAAQGQRVSIASIGGKPFDPQSTYRLATADFLILGGDEYDMLSKGRVVLERGTIDEILVQYLGEKK
jgi:2',3'-cyclic-nucleotide 2'-phosphodiesterase (5'-nucleotidase family)